MARVSALPLMFFYSNMLRNELLLLDSWTLSIVWYSDQNTTFRKLLPFHPRTETHPVSSFRTVVFFSETADDRQSTEIQ